MIRMVSPLLFQTGKEFVPRMKMLEKKRPHATRAKLLCVMLLAALLFSLAGCDGAVPTNAEHKALCTQFVDALLTDDFDTAYALIQNAVDEEEFSDVFEQMVDYVDGVKTYELKQIGWHVSIKNSVKTSQSVFEMKTDNGKTYTVQVITVSTMEGIAGIHLLDNSEFAEKTSAVGPINLVLKIISIIVFLLTLLLLIDCFRSKIRRKVLWAILIAVGLVFSVTIQSGIQFHFNIGVFAFFMGATATAASRSITLSFYLPIGAIVYLCLRGRLKREAAQAAQATGQGETLDLPDATVEASQEDDPPADSGSDGSTPKG